jgi:WhiB family redox-sensing transcriptional regulator
VELLEALMIGEDLPTLAELMQERPAWMGFGACRHHPELTWFPGRGDVVMVRAAVAVCRTCPVVDECRQYGLDRGEREGIWGGLSRRARRRLDRTGYNQHSRL